MPKLLSVKEQYPNFAGAPDNVIIKDLSMSAFIRRFLVNQYWKFFKKAYRTPSLAPPFLHEDNKKIAYALSLESYENILFRRLYFLHYSTSYMIEYYLIFDYLFNTHDFFDDNNPVILSLGCGAFLDYVGAAYAYAEKGHHHHKITYHGVDIVDWSITGTKLANPNVHFYHSSISNKLGLKSSRPINIIIFPKSFVDLASYSYNSLIKFINDSALNFADQLLIISCFTSDATTYQVHLDYNRKIDAKCLFREMCMSICKSCKYSEMSQIDFHEKDWTMKSLFRSKSCYNVKLLKHQCDILGSEPMRWAYIFPEAYLLENK